MLLSDPLANLEFHIVCFLFFYTVCVCVFVCQLFLIYKGNDNALCSNSMIIDSNKEEMKQVLNFP